jgi:hypothetical protein
MKGVDMRAYSTVFFGFVFILSMTAPSPAQESSREGGEEWRNVISALHTYRDKVTEQAEISIRSSQVVFNQGEPEHSKIFETFYDGENMRQDRSVELPSMPIRRNHIGVALKGAFIDWSNHDSPNFVAATAGLSDLLPAELNDSLQIMDMKYLGCTPHLYQLNPVRLNVLQDRKPHLELTTATMTMETLDGYDTYRIERVWSDGWKVVVWIDPDKGWAIPRIETIEINPEDNSETPCETMTATYQEWSNDGVWFPKEVITIEYDSQGDKKNTYTVTVEDAVFGTPVDESLFTIEGLDLPSETLVHDTRNSAQTPLQEISDGELTNHIPEEFKNNQEDEKAKSLTSVRLVIGGLTAVLFCILAFYFAFRARANSSEQNIS